MHSAMSARGGILSIPTAAVAANLSLDAAPGGCFCERLPNGGGVEHMRVTYVEPGKRIVLTGSLGPLLYKRRPA